MSYKDILAALENSATAAQLGEYAQSFADQFDAHLTLAGMASQFASAPLIFGEYPFDVMRDAQESATAAIDNAYRVFDERMSGAERRSYIRVDSPASVAAEGLTRFARHFDLTIMVQPDVSKGRGDPSALESVLFGSARPLILVPYILKGPAKFDKIICAWDGGAGAARAINAALPALKRAKSVEVLSLAAANKSDDLPGVDMALHLSRHGVPAELKVLPKGDDVGALLLSYAADEGADMLVMGGYGHSRWREFIMGGATRTILQSMTLPVFMYH